MSAENFLPNQREMVRLAASQAILCADPFDSGPRFPIVGRGGGYIISSSNSLTDDMKPENVRAMARAISVARRSVAG